MDTWLLVVMILLISLLFLRPVLSVLLLLLLLKKKKKLPPGPTAIPIISGLLWLIKPFSELEPAIRNFQARYGPIITIQIGSRPAIFISNRSLAHQALIKNGVVFSDRPPALDTSRVAARNLHNINSAVYGPTWRLVRRNLISEIIHPSRLKSYGGARKWVVDILADRLRESNVNAVDHFQYAMFSLIAFMCFGDRLDEEQINQIQLLASPLQLSLSRKYYILNLWPWFTKIVMKKRWEELFQLRKQQDDVLLPLIRARRIRKKKEEANSKQLKDDDDDEDYVVSYVDTLWDLEHSHDEKRKLTEDEIVSLCLEFLIAGVVATLTALQWIMANIVKYPNVQDRLFEEIKGVLLVDKEMDEEDLQKMPYLKAVILEGLRRHPPGHFVLPHSVKDEVVLGDHVLPKNATVNFMVADIGWDPEVWEDPMEFKPERFLIKKEVGGEEEFDLTGSREIKMMPFGVGRRMCPAVGMAMLHLEYFVANLVWKFEWRGVEGEDVDLSEKLEFTTVMKNPFKAHVSPRVRT